MAQPATFGLLLMAGERALGILLLLGGRFATVGHRDTTTIWAKSGTLLVDDGL